MSVSIGIQVPYTESSKFWDYQVSDNATLLSLPSPKQGETANVLNTTGALNPFASTKLKGLWVYNNGSWEYGSQDLQDKLVESIARIDANEVEISQLRTDLDRLILIESEEGTIQFSDNQYTELSRLIVPDGQDVVIPNNKNGVLNLSAPASAINWINNIGEITPPNGNGDSYIGRITFVVDPTLNNRNLVCKLSIDNGNSFIWSETKRLARGAGVDTPISIVLPYYTLTTFLANNGQFIINCDGDAEVWNIVYLIQKYKHVV